MYGIFNLSLIISEKYVAAPSFNSSWNNLLFPQSHKPRKKYL